MSKRLTEVDFELSRPMSWAEREAFRVGMQDDMNIKGHRFNKAAFRVVVYSPDESRELFQVIHDFLSHAFVNVYITAAHTVYPRVKV